VTACLLILKHHLGDLIEVSSDGNATDWIDGQSLAIMSTKLLIDIPKTIRQDKYCPECGQVICLEDRR
jgi:hypothetical protein